MGKNTIKDILFMCDGFYSKKDYGLRFQPYHLGEQSKTSLPDTYFFFLFIQLPIKTNTDFNSPPFYRLSPSKITQLVPLFISWTCRIWNSISFHYFNSWFYCFYIHNNLFVFRLTTVRLLIWAYRSLYCTTSNNCC